MFKAHLILAGTALLLAGTAQAAPEAQAEPESIAVAHQEAPAPSAHDDAQDTPNAAASAAEQELHPDARPVYLNGGHFGDN